LDLWVFPGHALEIYFVDTSAQAFCKSGVGGPKIHCPSVPGFSHQPENGSQVGEAFFG